MSNEYTDQWVDNVMDELDTLNAGPSDVYLIEFYIEHEQRDIMDLQEHSAQEAATLIVNSWKRWLMAETTGPGDLF